jgi:carbon monoxide dehydrogenase subunit G
VPEAEYSTRAALPAESVWAFVEELDNWAPFLRGYKRHEEHSKEDSTWVLKGDVGALSRIVTFEVHIDEWLPPSKVHFTLKGVNEQLEGEGTFLLSEDTTEAGGEGAHPASPNAAAPGFLARIVRWIYQKLFGTPERATPVPAASGGQAPDGASQLTFRLRVTPGGPMAPMVEALMRPLMLPVAEELAEKIMSALEAPSDPSTTA